jgi:hypothetical protein
MPNTHDIGVFFVHPINLAPGSPLIHQAPTDEIEPPYRHARSLIIKIWPGKGLVFGRWRLTGRTESDALYVALQGYGNALSTEVIRDTKRFDEVSEETLSAYL